MEFDKIVSIGTDCSSAFYIRNHWFRQTKNIEEFPSFFVYNHPYNKQYVHGSYFFDHLTITNLNSIVKLFDNKFTDVFNIENMKTTKMLHNNNLCVVDTKYDIMFYHLQELYDKFDKSDGVEYEKIFRRNYKKYKEKTDYLSDKINNLVNKKQDVLFVLFLNPLHQLQSHLDFMENFKLVMENMICDASLLILGTGDEYLETFNIDDNIYIKYVSGQWAGKTDHWKSWFDALEEFNFKNGTT